MNVNEQRDLVNEVLGLTARRLTLPDVEESLSPRSGKGFFGTMLSKIQQHHADAQQHLMDKHGMSSHTASNFLDSAHGRHMADHWPNIMPGLGKSVKEFHKTYDPSHYEV